MMKYMDNIQYLCTEIYRKERMYEAQHRVQRVDLSSVDMTSTPKTNILSHISKININIKIPVHIRGNIGKELFNYYAVT
jgi:hypothetical protein